jgi:hypothetical protein
MFNSRLCHMQILKVMQEEAKNTGKTEEIALKILAHNNLIGRIIGKQVNNIYLGSFVLKKGNKVRLLYLKQTLYQFAI